MARPTFEKQTDIPKGFEDEYEEQAGKWVPIDPTIKLAATLEKERELRKEAESVAKKAAKEARAAQEAADAHKAGLTEAELKKLHDDIEASIRAEVQPSLTEAEQVKAENRALKLNNVVKGLMGGSGFLPDKLDDAWKLHGDEFDLTSDGKPMVKGEPGKDVAKHVAEIAKRRPEWVQGTKAKGGGAAGVQSGGTGGGADVDAIMKNPLGALQAAHEAGATA